MLIVGSGFHKHVLGRCRSPLSCWQTLLKTVALRRGLDINTLDFSQPTLAWESMVMRLVGKDKIRRLCASDAENDLRQSTVDIIDEESKRLREEYRQHNVVRNIQKFNGHIVNLNFDHMLDQFLGVKKLKASPALSKIPPLHKGYKRDAAGLYRRWQVLNADGSSVTVWHPHGTVQRKESLRLGLRDYGLQPTLFSGAFDCFKAWERKILETRIDNQPFTEKQYLALIENTIPLDEEVVSSHQVKIANYNNWVTRFMLFDVFIIGAGISEAEVGLRWLLVQRQRNFARIKPSGKRPKTILFEVKENHPFGLMDHHAFASWDQAWTKALSC